ncbi:MAG TPA: DUF4097 family beta strand repeat-containing protein [Blastocatellia bacterium]|nr:DUF4097 family beta strand repeat-containing protein [Blastocatellia bacterium]HMV81516.1 DUF4097 family beta strand repeat-containing protein [Blastocatellia bacterium]HMX27743.1 DUF4097 family beta strand repeat-containing protein [Blastocatellia bacterium]HMZ21545.1 DUF4097 family beta strand repeat-containing protein [Blastocatellia bacterium]HNG28553.1 DUF4097 family beta strand repeat-containing protein [Blastocatellia bacterium]
MNKKLWMNLLVLLTAVCAISLTAAAQERAMSCENGGRNGDRANSCVIREQPLVATGSLAVDGKKNGGVSVKGWDQGGVLIRAKVQAWADTKEEADAIVGQIRVVTDAGVHAEGPETENRRGWSVSYEVFVPRNTSLSLKTHNGGISIADVRGKIDFDAMNGGVNLRNLAGNVKGTTRNGGLDIELSGSRWDGEGLDVTTTNGGIKMVMPDKYSARLETGTVNGGLKFDFPITVQGDIKRELSVNLGSGGPTIRARTTNGGVKIQRKG